MKRRILAASVVFACGSAAWAQENHLLTLPETGQADHSTFSPEAAWEWLPGDLVFRNGLNDFDEIVRENEAGQWASVAVIRPSGGGPVAIYVDEEQGVTETPLDLFIADEDYAVFRINSLETVRAESFDLGPMALFAGALAMNMPYDTEMMLENGSFYNAELPFAAALNAGILIATPKPLREITTPDSALGKALLTDRIGSFPCVEATDEEMCWGWMRNLAIVTPKMLSSSDLLQQVYP